MVVQLITRLRFDQNVSFSGYIGIRANGPRPYTIEAFSLPEGNKAAEPSILVYNQSGIYGLLRNVLELVADVPYIASAYENALPGLSNASAADVAPTAGSESCISRARSWLQECRFTHPRCGKSSWSPSRMLDISQSSIRLHIRKSVDETLDIGPYVALSHCWGQDPFLTTTRSNISDHVQSIDLTTLSKTFKDAAQISRDLDFPYLWIDSLCIIQDDIQDWYRESSQMADIFSKAALVIGATSSPTSNHGFLGPRRLHYEGNLDVMAAGSSGLRSVALKYRRKINHSDSNAHRPAAEGPLEKRAWAFQERYLAQRFLSFGEEEIWECNTACHCECSWAERLVRHDKHSFNITTLLKNSNIATLHD